MKIYKIGVVRASKSFLKIYNQKIEIIEYDFDDILIYNYTHYMKNNKLVTKVNNHVQYNKNMKFDIQYDIVINFKHNLHEFLYFDSLENAYFTKILNIEYFQNYIKEVLKNIEENTLNKLPNIDKEYNSIKNKYPEYFI